MLPCRSRQEDRGRLSCGSRREEEGVGPVAGRGGQGAPAMRLTHPHPLMSGLHLPFVYLRMAEERAWRKGCLSGAEESDVQVSALRTSTTERSSCSFFLSLPRFSFNSLISGGSRGMVDYGLE